MCVCVFFIEYTYKIYVRIEIYLLQFKDVRMHRDSPDNLILQLYHIPQLPILLLFFMTAQGPLQKIQATVWKMMQGLSWKMLIQLRHPLWLK